MRGKTAKILALIEEGKSYNEIVSEVGCSKPNITQAVKRYQGWNRVVGPLPEEHHRWIVTQARKHRMLPPAYVAMLLTNLIGRELTENDGE